MQVKDYIEANRVKNFFFILSLSNPFEFEELLLFIRRWNFNHRKCFYSMRQKNCNDNFRTCRRKIRTYLSTRLDRLFNRNLHAQCGCCLYRYPNFRRIRQIQWATLKIMTSPSNVPFNVLKRMPKRRRASSWLNFHTPLIRNWRATKFLPLRMNYRSFRR